MHEVGKSRFRHFVRAQIRQAWGRLVIAALCMLGFTLMQLAWPWPIKLVIDHVLLEKTPWPWLSFLDAVLSSDKVFATAAIASAIVLIALLRGLFSYGQLYLTSRIGYQLIYAVRRELFAHLQRLSLSFHHQARSGELLTKLTGDTAALRDVFTESALTFAGHLLTLIGMFAVMFALNWRLALIVLATLPILVSVLVCLYTRIRKSAKKQRRQEGKLSSRLSEALTSVPVIQAFGRTDYEVQRFESESAETLKESVHTARMEAAASRSVEIVGAVGTATVVLFGALQVLESALSPGDLLIFTGYLNSMFKPIRQLAKLATLFSKAAVGAERIAEVLEIDPEVQDSPDAVDAAPFKGEIVFDRVSFAYASGRPVLNEASFHIDAGRKAALVGGSGAGKSTLVSLILRLYNPQNGSISFDGIDIRRYRIESLRRQIAIVLQDALLFGATIRENIAYGKLDATREEIVRAAELANAHEFILALENGYDTVVGERGLTLSGGQQRRIAIARAIIRDAPILILDEPMTGLDAESEAKVREALERLMRGKTCLIITHDLQAAAETDVILVLKDGRVIEQGNHQALLALGGYYCGLYEKQVVAPIFPQRVQSKVSPDKKPMGISGA